MLVKLSINKPLVFVMNLDVDSVELEAFERFRLDRFASRHSCHRYVVAYEKDTSESTGIRVTESG